MRKKEMLKLISKPDVVRLFKSEEVINEIIITDIRLQEMFIERLPEEISADDIFSHWATDWKNLSNAGFVPILKKISRYEFKKITNLDKLVNYWKATPNRHLRAVLREIILERLPKRRLKVTVELIRDLNFIIFDHGLSD